MNHPFTALEAEYTHRLAVLKITREAQVDHRAAQLVKPQVLDHFGPAHDELGIPIVWMACSFERESGSDFTRSPAQGDRWDRVSTHVPRGIGPFSSFAAAARWSYQHDGIDKNSAPWSKPYACWAFEKFNGFGPRDHGRVSGYNFSGTNQYDPPTGRGGKYVSDGVWDSSAVDEQLGCVPLMLKMIELEPSLDFGPSIVPLVPSPPLVPVTPTPIGVGGGPHDTAWIQNAINMLGVSGSPLLVDGSYGRKTRNAVRTFQSAHGLVIDGLCGPHTFAALETALAAWKSA